MQRTVFWVLLALYLCVSLAVQPLQAQDEGGNLLKDPGFEGQYSGRGRSDLTIPVDWSIWVADSPHTEEWMNLMPTAFPHRGPDPDPRSGAQALNISRNFGTFTVAVYQQVSVPAGTNLNAKVWAWLKACDIPEGRDKCESNDKSGAFVRMGVDPNGGTNPTDSDIVWSGEARPHDRWDDIGVDVTATGDTVTVFLYASQRFPSALNKVYFDDAELEIGGEGTPGGGSGSAEPPPPAEVGFVSQQGENADGSIIHIVRPGDTIDSIAVAYGMTRQQVLDLNNLSDPRIIQIGQEIVIRPPRSPEESDNGEAESTPEITPTPTNTPAPAPVISIASGNVLPAADPAASVSSICVQVFEDANQNRLREDGETLVASSTIRLVFDGAAKQEYQTDGVTELHCFNELAPGKYTAIASAPPGYGLTTPDQLVVNTYPGATVNLAFGAAQGVAPPVPPPADSGALVNQGMDEQPAVARNPFRENLGLLVFGLAGIVLISGLSITLLLRRR